MVYVTGSILWGLLSAGIFTLLTAINRTFEQANGYAGVVFIVLIVVGVIYALIFTLSVVLRRESIIPTRKILIKYLVKPSESIAKRIGLDTNKLVRSFILLSNEFIEKELTHNRKKVKRVLILLPHCIQLSSCMFRITTNVFNCRKCGKCVVARFLTLSEQFAIDLFVSTGGTMARKTVEDRRPDLILAVACERDLLSGIKDTIGVPVIGILNERPNGPCYNTTVDPASVENVLKKIALER
jgi:hypothetical protein